MDAPTKGFLFLKRTRVLGPLLLFACDLNPAEPDELVVAGPERAVEIDVIARVEPSGQPAAWTGTVRMGAPSAEPLAHLACRRPAERRPEPGERGATEVRLTGPASAVFVWDEERGVWGAPGPRRSVDPTWAVGDVQWREPSGRLRVAEGAVRFGSAPVITAVERDQEGAVHLRWDPGTVGEVLVGVSGPAGDLVCPAEAGGIDLPWWSVPASGGHVILYSTRERLQVLEGGIGVRTRTTLELRVPLDEPTRSSVEEMPPRRGPPTTPRRLTRGPRSPAG